MRIFLSYRRSDTQDFAGRLADRLREAPGVRGVFLDVDRIAPGEDFETRLKAALKQCDVCLIVIGADWLGERADGTGARIAEAGDFVRLEVRQALGGGARIIPILANGALMPGASALPEELQGLVRLNAISVRHADFDRDVDYLLDVLFGRKRPGGLGAYLARHPMQRSLARGLAGFAVALIGLVAAAAIHFALTGRSLDQSLGGPGPTVVAIALVLIAGAALPAILSRPRA